ADRVDKRLLDRMKPGGDDVALSDSGEFAIGRILRVRCSQTLRRRGHRLFFRERLGDFVIVLIRRAVLVAMTLLGHDETVARVFNWSSAPSNSRIWFWWA